MTIYILPKSNPDTSVTGCKGISLFSITDCPFDSSVSRESISRLSVISIHSYLVYRINSTVGKKLLPRDFISVSIVISVF